MVLKFLDFNSGLIVQLFFYFSLVAAIFLILFPLYGLWLGVHPVKVLTNLTPSNFGWEFEEVNLKISDGIELSGWFIPASAKNTKVKSTNDKVIIMLHGYGADKANLLSFSEFLHDDFNLFYFDMRYFGKSQGNITTFGRDEQKDLEGAISFVKNRGFAKIGLMGFSFGGAVAILGAKNQNVSAVVTDSAYASLDLMGYSYYQNFYFLKYPLTFLTKAWGRIIFGIDADEISPEKTAKDLKIPVFLIHSKADQTIPFENALRLQSALKNNENAEFFFIENEVHGSLSGEIEREYEVRVLEFFNDNFEKLDTR